MYLSSTFEILGDLLYGLERYSIYQFRTDEVVANDVNFWKVKWQFQIVKVAHGKVTYNYSVEYVLPVSPSLT